MDNSIKTSQDLSQSPPFPVQDIEKLLQENVSLTDKISQLEITLEEALKRIQWFEEQHRLMKQRQFGKRSEVLSHLQEEMIFNADETPAIPTIDADTATTETITYTRQKANKIGRRMDTSLLPRLQALYDLSTEEKHCKECQGELHKICDEVSEQIETIPRQTYVVEHIHPQYGCRTCETVTSAVKPVAPIPKCMAGASLLTDVVVSKYEYHLPLYRQSQIFKGTGIDIPDNTLGNWVMQAGEVLRPLDAALEEEIGSAPYLQVDETPVKILEPEKKGYMWCYLSPLSPHKLIRFRFDLSRSSNVVKQDLGRFTGLTQTDGYAGYHVIRESQPMKSFGCMAHARRKFVEVVKLGSHKSTGKAEEALTYFAALYRIEEKARQQQLSFAERKLLRQQEAIPVVDTLKRWLIQTKAQVPPQSAIGRAIEYTLKQWTYLVAYVEQGEVEIDNNWVENQIRPFALGRRNWLFVGNEGSAQIGALFYSLIQSAKLNNLNARSYIHYLLTQVHALRRKEVSAKDLLPHRIDPLLLKAFAEQEYQKTKKLLNSSPSVN